MKVTLRKRLKKDKIVFYLDYYQNRIRKSEYLDIYLIPKPENGKLTPLQRIHNEESLIMAQSICHKRLLEIQSGKFDLSDVKRQKAALIPFLERLALERSTSVGNEGNWKSMLNYFKAYAHKGLSFEDITPAFLIGFKQYLDNVTLTNKRPLAVNTKVSYFNKLKAALKEARKLGILTKDIASSVSGYTPEETQREFLTEEEIRKIAQKDCLVPKLKEAFLFSVLTGLRWSDIIKLTWSELHYDESMGNYIRFRQKKTKGAETLAIPDAAIKFLGDRGKEDVRVFVGLRYSSWHNQQLQNWITSAGINKKVTFHIARHSHAVLQLSRGTDIFTLSKMLGHKHVATTMIYSNILDEKKKEAANRLNLEL
jgi:integrase